MSLKHNPTNINGITSPNNGLISSPINNNNNNAMTTTTTSNASLDQNTQQQQSNQGAHTLANSYFFYYMPKRPKNMSDYLSGLNLISGAIHTVEDFWSYYSHMIRPVDEFSSLSDIYLFKEGIRPVWEDPENQNGGKFVIKVRRNYTSKWWEDLLLAFIGEQIDGGDSINGVVISFRSADNSLIGIWNKDCNDLESKERVAASLRNLYRIEKVDYKPHYFRMTNKEDIKEGGVGGGGGDDLTGSAGLLNSSMEGIPSSMIEEFKQTQSPNSFNMYMQTTSPQTPNKM
ncbi:hypothetical protein DFA_09146 [Cavenderia fasciculata]|uniref:Uncharacterized protein n=1 Tax=Cavenderia fasciculata TaxID=261658 RepID=F4Q6T9_CACFS|nr:uncharacterized protein DFA_09146 [Cavenderia fasciculata]EGG16599.1 hypothetical protein DFA_09146 [Cavenderia fasciculata]|eukprot:XP_004354999.1 hypothetical protein DFA_09146 [Cavenderia fasciculata]